MFMKIVRDPILFPYLKDVQHEKTNFNNYFTYISGGQKEETVNPLLYANNDQ